MADEEKLTSALQSSLVAFARLREQMHNDGPKAVAASLNSMSESDVRQILLALVVTTERAEEGS